MPVCILKRFTGIGGMAGEKSRDSFWQVVRSSAAGISAGGLFRLKRAAKAERHFFVGLSSRIYFSAKMNAD